jgi:hypothetical protein
MKPIIDKRRENLYQVACLRLFETTHKGCVTENVGNHPNGYFNSSIQYFKDVKKNNEKKGATNQGDVKAKAPEVDVEMKE